MLEEAAVWEILQGIKDPEIPVISLVELGVVREIAIDEQKVKVTITPTFSGCPAMHVMTEEIERELSANGVPEVEIETVYAPAWSSDWITADGRKKLQEYGIAPPNHLVQISPKKDVVFCPFCKSGKTELRSEFGSTSCKEFHYCNECLQPFEAFKSI